MPIRRRGLQALLQEAVSMSRLMVIRGSGVGATFLMNLLVVRHFGAETNGLFQVGLSYAMIGAAVARLGQEQMLLRDIAGHRARDLNDNARKSLNLSLAVSVPAAFAVAAVTAFVAHHWGVNGGGMIPAFSLSIIGLAALWIVTEALRGWQMIPASVFWQGGFVPVAFVLAFTILETCDALQAGALPFLYAGCIALSLCGAIISWRRAVGPREGGAYGGMSWHAAAESIRRGSTFWILAILTSIAGWLDLLVLYAFADAAVVGVFQPIIRTGGLIAVAINIATSGLIARLALLYAAGNGAEFLRLTRLYWLAITSTSLVVGAVFIVMSPAIAAIWGPAIAPYHRELSFYVIIQLLQAVFIIAPLAGPVVGLERQMVVVQIANVPMKALAVIFGYMQGGLIGVIGGLGLCMVITVLWTAWLFVRRLTTLKIRWQSLITGRP